MQASEDCHNREVICIMPQCPALMAATSDDTIRGLTDTTTASVDIENVLENVLRLPHR